MVSKETWEVDGVGSIFSCFRLPSSGTGKIVVCSMVIQFQFNGRSDKIATSPPSDPPHRLRQ